MHNLTGLGALLKRNMQYVLTTTKGTLLPTNAYYLDSNFTTVTDSNNYSFTEMPS